MVETSASGTIFPFVCDNPECKKEYQQWEFFHVAGERGFIWLTNRKCNLIGLICPKCNRTTIRKYPLKTFVLNGGEADRFKYYVKSIPGDSIEFNKENTAESFQLPDDIKYFTPPNHPFEAGPPPATYPKWFEEKCLSHVAESDLQRFVEYENESQKKLFPRIVNDDSVYHFLDHHFLTSQNASQKPAENVGLSSEKAQSILVGLALIANGNYLSGEATNLTEEELQNLTCQFMVEPSVEAEIEHLADGIVKEYAQKRNDINFELTWKTDFLDKYIKAAFYKPDHFRSKRYFQGKWNYEEAFGKVFKGPFRRIHESQVDEIITCDEVAANLGVPPIRLIALINDGYLPAYHADHVYYDPQKENRGPNIDPQKFLYLKSEVDELILRQPPGLKSLDKPDMVGQDRPVAKETNAAAEYARLQYEEQQWQESLNIAVQYGLSLNDGEILAGIDDVIDFVHNHQGDTEIPLSTIDAIWNVIPDESKDQKGSPETKKYMEHKNREYARYERAELSDQEKKNLGQNKLKIDNRTKSIEASVKIGIQLRTMPGPYKKDDMLNEIEKSVDGLAVGPTKMVRDAVPQKYKLGAGNPNKIRSDDAADDF